MPMTSKQALRFIHRHGVVLESARGPVPSLAAAIAGETVGGNWWSHPKSQEIFALTRAVRDSEDVLVCRLVEGKVTYVHRRLWPALVRIAERIQQKRLARMREVHTSSGQHSVEEIPFPDWAEPEVRSAAHRLTEDVALAEFAFLKSK